MALYRIADFDKNYRDTLQGDDVKGMGVYADASDEKIGTVGDVLVDEEGHFRYLIVDLGFWIFGKKVLLPVGRSRIDYNAGRIYAVGMTREQADHLPEYNERETLDYDYEERVRGVYRNSTNSSQPLEAGAAVDTPLPLEASLVDAAVAPNTTAQTTQSTTYQQPTKTPAYNRDEYAYEQEPSLYGLNDQDHQTLKLYEERLIAGKTREKTGEVTIGKHVETTTTRVAVPIEKERVIVERVTPQDAGKAVPAGEASFREGAVAHLDVYEETPDIRKETVVHEEVRVKKVVDQETVEAQDTIRREQLDVNTSNLPVEER